MSTTWAEITDWAKSEIEKARTALEAPGLPPIETEVLRARIAAMRDLQAMKNPPTPPAIPPMPGY